MAANTARKLTVVDGPPAPKSTRGVAKKVTQTPCKRRCEVLSYFVGCGCLVGLGLSGIDSALAVQQFMHQPIWRASMLAIVIDFLLVCAELTTILTKCPLARRYAVWYIYGAGSLSIALNAAEFASGASGLSHQVLNAAVGGIVPLLVLVSSKYAGYLYLSSK